MKKRLLFSGALLFCSLATALPARAATFSVTSPADSGAGSLRDALAQANANADADTITFNLPPGTQSITLSSGALFIYNNVSIIGPGAGALKVDGNRAINNSVFGVSSLGSSNANPLLSVSISGLTITGGTGNPARLDTNAAVGGGVVNRDATLTLSNCAIVGNSARFGGGGVANTGGTLTLNNCTVSGNSAGNGGGILNARSSTSNSTLIVQNSLISNNSAGGQGGGINNVGVATLTGCTLLNNSAPNSAGGGIYDTSQLALTNCTFSGNSAGSGGAIFESVSSAITLTNCTLSGNTASSTGGTYPPGGGIYLADGSSTVTIGNTVLNNTNGNVISTAASNTNPGFNVTSAGYNICSDDAGASSNGRPLLRASTDKIRTDPKLGSLQFNGGPTPTFSLLAGSPALDAGNATGADQRGVARPFDDPNIANASGGNGSDIGAFELAPDTAQSSSTLFVTVPGDHDDGACGVQDCTLREAMNLANKQNNSATITFDPNVFSNSVQTIPLVAALPPVTSNMNIAAPSGGVRVAGQASFGILSVQGATLGLANLGFVGPGPFAISNRGTLNLNRVGIVGVGTGLYNSGTANVLGGVFSNNGTGINNSGTLQLGVAAFSGNTDGLLNQAGATANARNCLVSSNGNGFQNSGTLSLINSSFSFNGDALRNNGASALASFTQVTVAGNTNALINNGGTLNVLSNTISSNGGGLVNNSGMLNVRNTLSAGNGTNVAGTLNSNTFNLLSGTAGQAGLQTNSNGSPVLQDNGGGVQTIALVAGSPAINAGDPALADGTDERGTGFPRIQKGRADIGAFESGLSAAPSSFSLVVTTTTDEDNGSINPTQGNGTSLREAINAANLNGGGTISFDQSVFGSLQTITLNGSALPAITSDITVNGPSAGVGIEGRGIPLLLPIQSGNVTLARLKLSGAGVGIQNKGTLSFASGSLSNNGRGLLNISGATATLSNSSVQTNGTGISNAGLVFADGTIGGGNTDFLINTGITSMRTCTFASNGNAIQNSGQVTLVNSTIAFNGDGLRNMSGATSNQVQNTFVGNTNAILNASGAGIRIEACTVTGNGGGLINNGGRMDVNSTLAVSNGQNVSGTLGTNTFNLLTVTAQVAGLDTFSNGFPRLAANGGPTLTVALLSGSIALNAGDPNLSTGTDQRGFARAVGGRADIGAFEFGSSTASALRKSLAPKKSAPSAPSS